MVECHEVTCFRKTSESPGAQHQSRAADVTKMSKETKDNCEKQVRDPAVQTERRGGDMDGDMDVYNCCQGGRDRWDPGAHWPGV